MPNRATVLSLHLISHLCMTVKCEKYRVQRSKSTNIDPLRCARSTLIIEASLCDLTLHVGHLQLQTVSSPGTWLVQWVHSVAKYGGVEMIFLTLWHLFDPSASAHMQ